MFQILKPYALLILTSLTISGFLFAFPDMYSELGKSSNYYNIWDTIHNFMILMNIGLIPLYVLPFKAILLFIFSMIYEKSIKIFYLRPLLYLPIIAFIGFFLTLLVLAGFVGALPEMERKIAGGFTWYRQGREVLLVLINISIIPFYFLSFIYTLSFKILAIYEKFIVIFYFLPLLCILVTFFMTLFDKEILSISESLSFFFSFLFSATMQIIYDIKKKNILLLSPLLSSVFYICILLNLAELL